jgi:chromate transport protein ChrA
MYAIMPLAFRAFAYGILPTIFAQWLSALLLVAVAGFAYRKWTVAGWLGLVMLAELALLAFPTVAVFTTLVLVWVSLGWWLTNRRDADHRRTPVRVAMLLASGWLLAVVVYYGLYIDPVIASASAILGDSEGAESVARWPGGPLELVGWTANYVVSVLPWLLATAGLGLAFANNKNKVRRDTRVWLVTAWIAIIPVFMIANYRVDMIGKHLFFTMLPVAAVGGLFLWQLTRRQRWGMLLSGLVLITVGWQAIVFWFERLVRASS